MPTASSMVWRAWVRLPRFCSTRAIPSRAVASPLGSPTAWKISRASLCLLLLAQRQMDRADALECDGLPSALTYRPSDRQSFIELLQRLLLLSQRQIDQADVVECG